MDLLLLVVVAGLGYLAGRCRHRVVLRLTVPWRRRRPLVVVGALAATVPVWPGVQPGDPIADEMLAPAEVAVIVPLVLVFPVVWALLGRSAVPGPATGPLGWLARGSPGSIGLLLVAWVAGWSLWTVTAGSYGTPPTVDDGLRWHLIGAALIVAPSLRQRPPRQRPKWRRAPWQRTPWRRPPSRRPTWQRATWRRATWRRPTWRWRVGAVLWLSGVAATAAVPFVGDQQVPPRDAIPALRAAAAVVHEDARCSLPENGGFGPRSCWRRVTVAGDGAGLTRQLQHAVGCHRTGWLNPYELCLTLHQKSPSTVQIQATYYNTRAPAIY